MRQYTQAIIDAITKSEPAALASVIREYYMANNASLPAPFQSENNEEETSFLEHILQSIPNKEDDHWSIIAQAWARVGQDHYEKGHYDQALKFCEESFTLFARIQEKCDHDTINIGFTHVSTGHVYYRKKDHDRAIREYEKSLALFDCLEKKPDGVWKIRSLALSHMGEINSKRKNYAEAKKNYESFIDSVNCMQEKPSDVSKALELAYQSLGRQYQLIFAADLDRDDLAAAINSVYEFLLFYFKNLAFLGEAGPRLFDQLDILKFRELCQTKRLKYAAYSYLRTLWNIVKVISCIFMTNPPATISTRFLQEMEMLLSLDPQPLNSFIYRGLGLFCRAIACALNLDTTNVLNPDFVSKLMKEGAREHLGAMATALEEKLRISGPLQNGLFAPPKDSPAEKDGTMTAPVESKRKRDEEDEAADARKKSQPDDEGPKPA